MRRSATLFTLCLCVFSLWAKDPSILRENTSLLSPSFSSSFTLLAENIYEKSGITFGLLIGEEPELTTSSVRTVTLFLSKDTVLFISSPDLSLMGDMQRQILQKETSVLVREGKYEEAIELLFVNYVELIAHSESLSYSELLEISPKGLENTQGGEMYLVLIALLVLCSLVLLKWLHWNSLKIKSGAGVNSVFFGKSLWKK